MSSTLKRREILLVVFLFFFVNSCSRPEDNAIKPLTPNISPVQGSQLPAGNLYVPKKYTIEISSMKFHPASIVVHAGDTISWKNNDLLTHCVTELPTNTWTSSQIPSGGSWQMIANTSADYFCAIHLVMKGKIIVK